MFVEDLKKLQIYGSDFILKHVDKIQLCHNKEPIFLLREDKKKDLRAVKLKRVKFREFEGLKTFC